MVIHCSELLLRRGADLRGPSAVRRSSASGSTGCRTAACAGSRRRCLTIFTLAGEPGISSSAGAIMRQGPHHSTEVHDRAGRPNTSDSKVVSETLPTAMGISRCRGAEAKCLVGRVSPQSVKAASREVTLYCGPRPAPRQKAPLNQASVHIKAARMACRIGANTARYSAS